MLRLSHILCERKLDALETREYKLEHHFAFLTLNIMKGNT